MLFHIKLSLSLLYACFPRICTLTRTAGFCNVGHKGDGSDDDVCNAKQPTQFPFNARNIHKNTQSLTQILLNLFPGLLKNHCTGWFSPCKVQYPGSIENVLNAYQEENFQGRW